MNRTAGRELRAEKRSDTISCLKALKLALHDAVIKYFIFPPGYCGQSDAESSVSDHHGHQREH